MRGERRGWQSNKDEISEGGIFALLDPFWFVFLPFCAASLTSSSGSLSALASPTLFGEEAALRLLVLFFPFWFRFLGGEEGSGAEDGLQRDS